MNYLGDIHGFNPKNAMDLYRSEHIFSYFNEDFLSKHMYKIMLAKPEDKPALIAELFANAVPAFFANIAKKV